MRSTTTEDGLTPASARACQSPLPGCQLRGNLAVTSFPQTVELIVCLFLVVCIMNTASNSPLELQEPLYEHIQRQGFDEDRVFAEHSGQDNKERTMIYRQALLELENIVSTVAMNGAEIACFTIDPPASPAEIAATEQALNQAIPDELKIFFQEGTSNLDLYWLLERDSGPGMDELGESLGGSASLALKDLSYLVDEWSCWEDYFRQPQSYVGGAPNRTAPGHKEFFPLQFAGNGDVLACKISGDRKGQVILINHEGGDFDWITLEYDLESFLKTWLQLGCPGPESWDLEAIYDFGQKRLSLHSEMAQLWLQALGLTPREGTKSSANVPHRVDKTKHRSNRPV